LAPSLTRAAFLVGLALVTAPGKGPGGTYDGNLAGRYRIRMTLVRDVDALTGTYVYEEYPGVTLKLSGKVEKDGTFSLDEADAQGKETGTFTGSVNRNGSLEGRRTRPDGSGRVGFYARSIDPEKAALSQPPGRLEGSWSWEQDGRSFRLDVLHRGGVVEGFYQASDGTRTERECLVVGNVAGATGIVDWTSSHSGKKGSARLTAQSNTLRWELVDIPAAEFFAPAKVLLRRAERQ
jgi:hypothetical protein